MDKEKIYYVMAVETTDKNIFNYLKEHEKELQCSDSYVCKVMNYDDTKKAYEEHHHNTQKFDMANFGLVKDVAESIVCERTDIKNSTDNYIFITLDGYINILTDFTGYKYNEGGIVDTTYIHYYELNAEDLFNNIKDVVDKYFIETNKDIVDVNFLLYNGDFFRESDLYEERYEDERDYD